MAALSDEDDEVRSNAAFATGMLCYFTKEDISAAYPSLLTKLAPLFSDQAMPFVTDNACGAVARMIRSRIHAVPMDQVFPALLNAMPLKRDFAENETVFDCLFELFRQHFPLIYQNLPKLIGIFADVLEAPDQLKLESRQTLVDLLKNLSSQDANSFASIVQALPAGKRQVLIASMQ
jgi:hypothetical protein